jgi:hypothetical protein
MRRFAEPAIQLLYTQTYYLVTNQKQCSGDTKTWRSARYHKNVAEVLPEKYLNIQ